MSRKILIFSFITIFLLLANFANSQRSYLFTREWKISMFIGSTTFHGDVSDKTNSFMNNTPFSKYFYQDRKVGGGFYVDKMFTPYWGVRGTLLYAKMKSTKESSKIYFEGDLFEYSVSGLIDFSNIFLGVDRYRVWNFYGFIGVGFTETRSILYDLNTGARIGSTGFRVGKTGAYKRMTELTFPVGLGVKYEIGKKINLFFEFTRHIVKTDRLDAYPVDGTKFESLGMMNLGFTYNFRLPNHWTPARNPRYNGKSPDRSIRAFNKKKHVVMKTKAYKKAKKSRKKYGRKRRRNNRW